MRRLFHFHRTAAREYLGHHAYMECRCGARRVRRLFATRSGPVIPGWPPPVNRAGMPIVDTGWRRP